MLYCVQLTDRIAAWTGLQRRKICTAELVGEDMKITFLGAAHEVTGSCYYLEAAGKKFLVDCGLF